MKSNVPTLANNQPINKTALRVILPGTNYVVDIPKLHKMWETMPPLRIDRKLTKDPNFQDFTGIKFGRLTVMGLSKEYIRSFMRRAFDLGNGKFQIEHKQRNRGGFCKWIVRCNCGYYEERTTKQIKKACELDRCYVCHHLIKIKSKGYYLQNGIAPTKKQMKEMGW